MPWLIFQLNLILFINKLTTFLKAKSIFLLIDNAFQAFAIGFKRVLLITCCSINQIFGVFCSLGSRKMVLVPGRTPDNFNVFSPKLSAKFLKIFAGIEVLAITAFRRFLGRIPIIFVEVAVFLKKQQSFSKKPG